jgi:Zn-dependent protease with chaperone function
MFEWFSQQYLKLMANYKILLANPVHCSAVDLLRLFTFTLFVLFLIKLLLHLVVFHRLRRRFPRYSEATNPALFRLFQAAAQKAGVRRLPPLYQFRNERPLVFTIGSLRPAIFLAPQLVEKLPPKELESALAHELTHVKRHDNLLVWLLEIFFVAIPLLIIQVFAISFVFSIENSVYAILGALAVLTIFKAFLWKRILFWRELSCDDLTVDAIKDPLLLASSLINVWRIGKVLPRHRWQAGLAFAQTLLPAAASLEFRAQRLIDYRRPWFKFFLGKVARVAAVVFVVLSATFLWRFYSDHRHLHLGVAHDGGFHFFSYQCDQHGTAVASTISSQERVADELVKVVDRYAKAINAEDYIGIQNVFSKKVRDELELKKIKPMFELLLSQYGEIRKLDSPLLISPNQAIFTVHFERAILDMQVAFDDEENKITDTVFLPDFDDHCEPLRE